MRVVVDVNPFGVLLFVKTVKVKSFRFVLADVVTNHHVTIGSFHDPAKPMVVVAVVVLNKRVNAVEVRIESAAIYPALANVSIGLVVLDLNAVGVEAENAVAGVIAAAVS